MLELDQILRANEINFAILAALPAFFLSFLLLMLVRAWLKQVSSMELFLFLECPTILSFSSSRWHMLPRGSSVYVKMGFYATLHETLQNVSRTHVGDSK